MYEKELTRRWHMRNPKALTVDGACRSDCSVLFLRCLAFPLEGFVFQITKHILLITIQLIPVQLKTDLEKFEDLEFESFFVTTKMLMRHGTGISHGDTNTRLPNDIKSSN
jgi:hypothetical protein